MGNTCDICGLRAKTPQGLAGHKQYKHELAGEFEQARELAGSVEMLEGREAELRTAITALKHDAEEAEKKVAEFRQQRGLSERGLSWRPMCPNGAGRETLS
jgi:hypothetical protein